MVQTSGSEERAEEGVLCQTCTSEPSRGSDSARSAACQVVLWNSTDSTADEETTVRPIAAEKKGRVWFGR